MLDAEFVELMAAEVVHSVSRAMRCSCESIEHRASRCCPGNKTKSQVIVLLIALLIGLLIGLLIDGKASRCRFRDSLAVNQGKP